MFWAGISCWLYFIPFGFVNGGSSRDLLLLGDPFWWLYLLGLAAPFGDLFSLWAQVDLSILLYHSLCMWFMNNAPRTFWSNDMKWITCYDCYFWAVCYDSHSGLVLNDQYDYLSDPGIPRGSYLWPIETVMQTMNTEAFLISDANLVFCLPGARGELAKLLSCYYFGD